MMWLFFLAALFATCPPKPWRRRERNTKFGDGGTPIVVPLLRDTTGQAKIDESFNPSFTNSGELTNDN